MEHDHPFIKKRVRSMLAFKSFSTATSILAGVEAMHVIKKEINSSNYHPSQTVPWCHEPSVFTRVTT